MIGQSEDVRGLMMVMAVVGFSGITLPSDMGVLLLLALAFIAAGITPIWMLPCCGMLLPGRCLLGLMTAFPAVPRGKQDSRYFLYYIRYFHVRRLRARPVPLLSRSVRNLRGKS